MRRTRCGGCRPVDAIAGAQRLGAIGVILMLES